jgi:hypothetical protein
MGISQAIDDRFGARILRESDNLPNVPRYSIAEHQREVWTAVWRPKWHLSDAELPLKFRQFIEGPPRRAVAPSPRS